jgi:putative tricarboxylic transport membrane protein
VDTLHMLLSGFGVALTPENLFLCAVGVITGTVVGALPGIGSAGACAILLPVTFKLGPVGSLIMLAGIFYGTQYGGTITSVMMSVPGESASVVTMLDGNPLARQGRAGVALGLAAIGSFIGGTLSVIGLMLFGPPLAGFALELGPPEYFSLMVFSLSLVCAFAGKSLVRGLIAVCMGLILAVVGLDSMTGQPRLTFGFQELLDGIEFLPVAVGMFGLSETIESFEKRQTLEFIKADVRLTKVLPNLAEMRESFWPMVRGTVIGFFVGIFPGAGPTISSFISYGVEQRVSRHPEQFGKGALAGVAGPETANNAATGGAMIPMLSLGLPSSPSTALMLAALVMFGLRPGPTLFREAPEVVWGLIGSLYIGNVMLVIINIACIPLLVYAMDKVARYLPLGILLLSAFGVYSSRNSVFDIGVMLVAAVAGYLMRKVDIPQAPVILGLLLGGQAESSLRQAMVLSDGHPGILVTRPLSAVFLVLAAASLLLPTVVFKKKAVA